MRRTLIGMACALALAACATNSSAPTPAQAVFEAKAALVSATQLATEYAQLPRCPQPSGTICSDPATVDNVDKSVHAAAAVIDAAETTVRDPAFANSSDVLSKSVLAAQNAVTALQSITSTLKVTP